MPSAVRAITRIQDADDFTGSLTDTYIPVWSNSQQKFVMTAQATTSPGGSSGYIQYNNAGAFGASGLYWDSANSRVGIGTASPGFALSVSGASDNQLSINGDSGQYVSFYFTYGGSTRKGQFFYDNTNAIMGFGGAAANVGVKFFYGNGTTAMTILGANGNVGIGTTSPGQKLDVNGSVNVATALISPDIRPASNAVNSTGFSNASGTRVFSVDTTNKRVGINNTSPSGILHATATDNTPAVIGETSLAGGNAWIYIKNPAQTWAILNRGNDSNSFNLWDVTNNQSVLKILPFTGTFPVFSFNASTYTGRPIAIKHSGNGQIGLDNATNLTWVAGTWNDATFGLASGDFGVFPLDQNGKIAFFTTTDGSKKMVLDTSGNLDVTGTVQMDGLRIDVTPTAETITCTHTITFSANGTNYKIPCAAA